MTALSQLTNQVVLAKPYYRLWEVTFDRYNEDPHTRETYKLLWGPSFGDGEDPDGDDTGTDIIELSAQYPRWHAASWRSRGVFYDVEAGDKLTLSPDFDDLECDTYHLIQVYVPSQPTDDTDPRDGGWRWIDATDPRVYACQVPPALLGPDAKPPRCVHNMYCSRNQ